MTFVCDVIVRAGFKALFPPSVCSWGLAKPDEIVFQKVTNVRANFFFLVVFLVFKYTVSPAENNSRDMFILTLFEVFSIL